MRKLSELYTILLELVESRLSNDLLSYHTIERGICYHIDMLGGNSILSKDEYILLSEHFRKTKPSPKSRWAKNSEFTGGNWWWVCTKLGWEQRVLFLKYRIKMAQKQEEKLTNR